MAKADLVLPSGTRVTIEGTAQEVAMLLATVGGQPAKGRSGSKKTKASTRHAKNPGSGAVGAQQRIEDLVDEGFFRKDKGLSEVRDKLSE